MKLVKETQDDSESNQMSLISDTDEVVKFLEAAGQRSILNEHTVNCRLTACNNLFSILTEGEDTVDYMLQNLDVLINRFKNKHNNVQASTLKVYKSRVKSSLEDFRAWNKNPLDWEKSVTEKAQGGLRDKRPRGSRRAKMVSAPPPKREAPTTSSPGTPVYRSEGNRKVSFPIRPDYNLEFNIPAEGLTLRELLRLGLFLYPYCRDIEARDEQSPWSVLTN